MQLSRELTTEKGTADYGRNYEVRRGATRGRMRLDWLDARFSFSFGPYRNPARNHFGVLQALNEDVIQPGTGFEPHPHEDLEIFILPLHGAVEHRDNLGNYAVVRPGDVQKMTAGSGIWHSQMNASTDELDHHLQIWLRPRHAGLAPAVDQRSFEKAKRRGNWQILISESGRDGSLSVDQDVTVARAELEPGKDLTYRPAAHRSMYLHVIQGEVGVANGGNRLEAGDAYVMANAAEVTLRALNGEADVLLFDLPPLSRGQKDAT